MKQVTTSLCQTLPNNPVEKPLSLTVTLRTELWELKGALKLRLAPTL